MDIKKILEYQKKDAELNKLEKELVKSECKKIYQEMVAIVKQAQDKSASLEAQAGTIKDEIERLNKQYKENSNNVVKVSGKDFASMKEEEIENLISMMEALENNLSILEKKMLAEAEKLNITLTEFEKTKKVYGNAKAKYIDNKKQYDELVKVKEPEMEKIKQELVKMEKDIDPKVLAKYKQHRQDKLFPIFTPLADKSCSFCMLELSAVEVDKIKSQGYLECDNCHRIIYNSENNN